MAEPCLVLIDLIIVTQCELRCLGMLSISGGRLDGDERTPAAPVFP